MLAMGRALMSKPKIILMDEPSWASPIFVNEIFDIIKEVSESGTTVLLVEQNAKKALSIADRAYVLETGRITLEGKASDLLHDESVQKAYLGSKQEGFGMENFVITIARQYGSGGRTVGKMLAEKLGVSFYDKQIIQMASDESGIDVKLFGQVEEGSSVKASLFNKTGLYKGDLIAPDQKGFVSDENIFNYQAKIATDLAEKESCVIVGRCVNYVFKDRPNTLRVFVHAPWEFRVEKSREKISGSDGGD